MTPNPFIEIASGFPLLSLVTFLPLVGAVLVALVPKDNHKALHGTGLFVSILTFFVSLFVWRGFQPIAGFQMVDKTEWLPGGIYYLLGIDGLSLLLVMLTTLITPIALLSATSAVNHRVKEFVINVLILETGMLGSLMALDLFFYYLFWEAMLIPMYLLIGIWGGKERLYATTKFFIYTMFGSVLMLIAMVYLYLKTGMTSSAFVDVLALNLTETEQIWLFLAFALAFGIKVPVFPLHTWLPDAHTQAPTAGSVILAGILLKVGTYAFLRFGFPLFPYAAGVFSTPFMALAVLGILYGAFLAYAQTDVKKLVAYSSVSHLGFVMLGMFAFTEAGVEGSLLQMVNHGISTGGLFLCVGILYERRHTRAIADYGGLAKQVPVFTVFFMIMTLSSIGLPGTNGFVGEFIILAGTFQEALQSQLLPVSPWDASLGLNGNLNNLFSWLATWRVATTVLAILAVLGVVFGAVYMLSMFRRVMFGPLKHEENKTLKDLTPREFGYLLPLAILVFAIGFFPNAFMEKTHASVDAYVSYVRPEVAAARAPITDKIQKSRRGIVSVDTEVPFVVDAPPALPAGPAAPALPKGGN